MPKVYTPEDRSDEAFDKHVQDLADAFAEGRRAGRLGHTAGMCPQDYTDEERGEWNRGRLAEIAALLDPEGARRAA